MPIIRTYKALQELRPTIAEELLIAACRAGLPCKLGHGGRPGMTSPYREVRADVLRFLILGGDGECRVAAWGVRLQGAYITGQLNLSHTEAHGLTKLKNCRFDRMIEAQNFTGDALNLEGSALPGIKANGACFAGDVFLQGAEFGGDHEAGRTVIDLESAQISGNLNCTQSIITAQEGWALNAQNAKIEGDVDFRGMTALGGVALAGGHVEGQLQCEAARFYASGPHSAFFGHRMRVSGSFVWRPADCEGEVDLISAGVGDLADDLTVWQDHADLHLDGFVYEKLVGSKTSREVRPRLQWLEKGANYKGTFFPQPYTQLARVLRGGGHDFEARSILEERERLLRKDYRTRLIARMDGKPLRQLLIQVWTGLHFLFADLLLRWVVGYGHRPFRSLVALTLLIVAALVPAYMAWDEGSFAPNSGVIQVSAGWQLLLDHDNPAAIWSADGAPGQDWESFNSLAYALDVVVPIIDFGQTEAWTPSTTRGDWGWHLWWGQWVLTAAGWIVTALGAAAITGLIRSD